MDFDLSQPTKVLDPSYGHALKFSDWSKNNILHNIYYHILSSTMALFTCLIQYQISVAHYSQLKKQKNSVVKIGVLTIALGCDDSSLLNEN